MKTPVLILLAAALISVAACGQDTSSEPDAGTPGLDAGLPGADASEPGVDGSDPGSDASGAGVDATPAGRDASGPGADAAPGPDASVSPDVSVSPDAGSGVDSGTARFGYDLSPLAGSVVFNEVLMDGTTDGDPNGDGDANPVEDQFVEIVNIAATPLVMDDFTLVDRDFADLPRHTFLSFTLSAGKAVVVFGGGDAPASTASATFFTANAADPGIPFGLHLATPADHMLLLDSDGRLVAHFCYGDAQPAAECAQPPASDQSLTRSPDLSGSFTGHLAASGSGGTALSVGTRVDGSAF